MSIMITSKQRIKLQFIFTLFLFCAYAWLLGFRNLLYLSFCFSLVGIVILFVERVRDAVLMVIIAVYLVTVNVTMPDNKINDFFNLNSFRPFDDRTVLRMDFTLHDIETYLSETNRSATITMFGKNLDNFDITLSSKTTGENIPIEIRKVPHYTYVYFYITFSVSDPDIIVEFTTKPGTSADIYLGSETQGYTIYPLAVWIIVSTPDSDVHYHTSRYFLLNKTPTTRHAL